MVRREAGFTLLEVLVAFIIAALALGLMFESAADGFRAARVASHYEEAISRARSHLAALQVQPITSGTQRGDDGGGFRWVTHEQIAGTAAVPPNVGIGTPVLYALSVTITWNMDGAARGVTLNGARLDSLARQP